MKRFLPRADRVSIRKQIGIVCAGLAFSVACVVAGSAAYVARNQAIEDANGELLNVARNMADRLDSHMAERYRELKNVAALGLLKPIWKEDSSQIRGVLDQIQAGLPEYAWIGFADTTGTVRSATGGTLEGASVASRPWFIQGLKKPSVQDVHEAMLLSRLLPAQPDRAPFRFVDVAMPVTDAGGKSAGVLGAHLSWSWAKEVREGVLAAQSAADQTDIWVMAEDGTVLLGATSSSRPFSFDQVKQTTFVDRHGSDPQLTAIVSTTGQADYPGLGWRVVARRPVSVALAPATRLTHLILTLGSLAALVGSAVGWALGAALSAPLARLTHAVDQIGRDPKARLRPQHGSTEAVALSMSLRSLLRRLGSAEQQASEARRAQVDADVMARTSQERVRRLGADIELLRAQADQDPLTGLLNRRAFLPVANDAMSYFTRYKRQISVVMIDIDRFKGVNDTFGHAAGDIVIQSVAKIIAAQIRGTDKVARFGGEEFVVLLRECALGDAEILADRIRQTVSGAILEFYGAALQITISAGVAEACATDRDVQDVIERADRGLYKAKRGGRNRVEVARQEVPALGWAA